jgi:hypothetical protein
MRVITRSESEAWEKLRKRTEQLKNQVVKPDESGAIGETEKKDSMLSALGKYIPATVIVGYTFLDTIFRSVTPPPVLLWMVIFIFMLVTGAGLLTWRITDSPCPVINADQKKDPDTKKLLENWMSVKDCNRLKQAGIAMIAFAGYVLSLGGPFPYINTIVPAFVWQAYYGAVALVLATLLIAIIIGKDLLTD